MTMEAPDPKIAVLLRSWEGKRLSRALPGEERRLMFLSMDNEVCLVWLGDALQQLRQEGQTKVLGYLDTVLEEVVFEAKMTAG